MTTALVIGKFLPPHLGHRFLAERARELADEVIVCLLAHSQEPITVAMRHTWLEELLPWANVRSGVADHPIDFTDPAVYDLWAATIREVIARDRVDVLVTSEPAYGDLTAVRLGARHVLADPARTIVPISASAIRRDPWANWAFIGPGPRAWYARRVCLVGAESTGTTTMTERLAERFGTSWVPEYGREYSIPKDARGESWSTDDFVRIARRQLEMEEVAARACDRVVFCDTDPMTTALWHETYLGRPAPEVMAISRAHRYDLTFLTAADFPWVQDGTRASDGQRQRMQRRFEAEVTHRHEPVIELRGSIERRMATALAAIDERLGLRPAGEGAM